MNTATFRRLLPASLALALLIGGCNGNDTNANAVSIDTLTAQPWSLVEATDAEGLAATNLTGGDRPPIELNFQPERMGVSNACNGMGRDYELENNTLKVGQLVQTMMACEPALMARENTIKTYLQQPLQVQFDDSGSRLTLSGDAGVLVFQPATP